MAIVQFENRENSKVQFKNRIEDLENKKINRYGLLIITIIMCRMGCVINKCFYVKEDKVIL